jgi:hypothetical protein
MRRCLGCGAIQWPWSLNFRDVNPLFDRLCAECAEDYQVNVISLNMDCLDKKIEKMQEMLKRWNA